MAGNYAHAAVDNCVTRTKISDGSVTLCTRDHRNRQRALVQARAPQPPAKILHLPEWGVGSIGGQLWSKIPLTLTLSRRERGPSAKSPNPPSITSGATLEYNDPSDTENISTGGTTTITGSGT